MKALWNNLFGRVLRNEADGSDGGGGSDSDNQAKGLVSGLETFINDNPGTTGTSASSQQAQGNGQASDDSDSDNFDSGNRAPDPKDNTAPAPKVSETKTSDETDDDDDDDFGLPDLGGDVEPEKKSADVTFDEASFDAQTDKEVEGLDPKQGESWKQLKGELKKYKQGEISATQLQTRVTELESKNQELEETAARVKAMEERVKSVTSRNAELLLEESDEYQNKVALPHEELSKTVAALSEAKGISANDLWAAIKENDPVKRMSMIDSLEGKIGARHALTVQGMADDIRMIARTDQHMRADAEKIVEKHKAADLESRQGDVEKQIGQFQNAAKESFKQYSDRIPGFTDDSKSLTDEAKSAQAKAMNIKANDLSSGDLGYMVFSTQALPAALRAIKRLESENRDLRVVAGDRAKDIAPGGTKKKVAPDNSHMNSDTGKPKTFMEGFLNEDFIASA